MRRYEAPDHMPFAGSNLRLHSVARTKKHLADLYRAQKHRDNHSTASTAKAWRYTLNGLLSDAYVAREKDLLRVLENVDDFAKQHRLGWTHPDDNAERVLRAG